MLCFPDIPMYTTLAIVFVFIEIGLLCTSRFRKVVFFLKQIQVAIPRTHGYLYETGIYLPWNKNFGNQLMGMLCSY